MVVLLFSMPLNTSSHLISVGRAHDYKYLIPSAVNKTGISRELQRYYAFEKRSLDDRRVCTDGKIPSYVVSCPRIFLTTGGTR